MGQLFDVIRQLVAEERYIVGQHASDWKNVVSWSGTEMEDEKSENTSMTASRTGVHFFNEIRPWNGM